MKYFGFFLVSKWKYYKTNKKSEDFANVRVVFIYNILFDSSSGSFKVQLAKKINRPNLSTSRSY